MKFKTIAAAFAFATLGTSAFAQAYVGIGLGASHSDVACRFGVNCGDGAAAGKALVGYTFPGTDFAIEGIYTHLGTFKEDAPQGQVDAKADTFGVGGAWRPQFGAGWGGVLRAGVGHATTKLSYTPGPPGLGLPLPTIGSSGSRGSWGPYFGVGATYAITPTIRLEADLDSARVKAQQDRTAISANSWTLGATFAF